MQAFPKNFAGVFANKGDIHFVLPHFQREYRWEEKHWKTLWDDAILTHDALPDVSGATRSPEHFLGALVVVPDGTRKGTVPVHRLVDGQQRLTTISLLLCALGEVVKTSHPAIATTIQKLLLNVDWDGDLRFKLLPTTKNNDRAIYCAIIQGQTAPHGASHVLPAFQFFKRHIISALEAGHITADNFFETLAASFQIVWVELDKDENAYQIFESLNTKGERLGEVDLVRNYIAMRLPSGAQEKVFFEIWAPIENRLNDEKTVGRSGLGELTAFLRHFDAMKSGVLPAEKNIYARFRDAMKNRSDADLIADLREIGRFAALYDGLLRPDKGDDAALRRALSRLNALEISVAYPFLLFVADAHARGEISVATFIETAKILENYLVRRFLVDEPTHYLNKMFAALAGAEGLNLTDPDSLRRVLSEKRYPSDDRIRQLLPRRELYDKAAVKEKTVMLFERINAHFYRGSDVKVVLDGAPTLEHILPQTLTPWWKNHLGEDADAIAREWKHTLGNLTLVTQSYNSSLSNDSFEEKKQKLIAHGLRLNSDYFTGAMENWDAEAIQNRAEWLTEKVLEIWPSFAAPSLPSLDKTYYTPVLLSIRGEEMAVSSWRDVLRQVAEWLVRDGADFRILNEQFAFLIRDNAFNHGNYQISNSWFLNTNWSADSVLKYAPRLLATRGVKDDEWKIEDKPV